MTRFRPSALARALPAALLALSLAAPAAEAQLLTGPIANAVTITDFRCDIGYCFGRGPLQVGAAGYGVTWTSNLAGTNSPDGSIYGGTATYGLNTNGFWTGSAGTYAATDAGGTDGAMRFLFDFAVSEVGAFMNYAPGSGQNAFLRVLGLGGVVLEEYDLLTAAPIVTPNANNGQAFRGVRRAQGDIRGVELSGSYLVTRNLVAAPATVVPEPGTWALLATGLAGLAVVARRRRAH